MKALSLVAIVFAAAFTASAAEEVTLTGKATCAKCELKKSEKCESVLQVSKDGKTTTYYLEGKPASGFHKEICSEAKSAKATGTVSKKDGKDILTVSKIEAVAAKK
jgi:hypothetical protein